MDHEVALPLRALRRGGGTDVFVTLLRCKIVVVRRLLSGSHCEYFVHCDHNSHIYVKKNQS